MSVDPENWVAQERDEELAARDQQLPPEDDRPSRQELAEDERQTLREQEWEARAMAADDFGDVPF